MARADFLFREGTLRSVRLASLLEPDNWKYWMLLAQLDREHAVEMLLRAQSLDRYNAQADIELGLQYESEGDLFNAEKLLKDAFDVDRTYLPRWTLANYYFRRGNMTSFWEWARKSAEMPSEDVGPLFALCWRASSDPAMIAAAILNHNPEVDRQYLQFLLTKDQPRAEADVAQRLVNDGQADDDRPLLLSVIDHLVSGNDPSASEIWHMLIERHWVNGEKSAPNNPEFIRQPIPVRFDWALPQLSGLHSWPGPLGLDVEFSGSEPEECTIAEQVVSLPQGDYELTSRYATEGVSRSTGIRWQIVDAQSSAVLAESSDLWSDSQANLSMKFSVPAQVNYLDLRLVYRRSPGTSRVAGTLMVRSAGIEPAGK